MITRLSNLVRSGGWNGSGDALFFCQYQPGRNSLWQVPLAGGPPRAVMELGEQPLEIAVAAAGRRLVYSETVYQANVWRLRLDAPAAEPEPVIVSTAFDGAPAVSPDGRRIAFIFDRSGFMEIWTADAGGTAPRRQTSFEGPLLNRPRWSPDGDRLVVEVNADTGSDVYLVPLAGAPRRLTSHPSRDVLPAFSAGGDHVYFALNRDGGWQIWRAPAAGGAPEPVTGDGGHRVVDLGPEGLFLTRKRQPYLFRLDPGGDLERLCRRRPAARCRSARGWRG